jgi:hypothetical protein
MPWPDVVDRYRLVAETFQRLTASASGLPASEKFYPSLFHVLQMALLHISIEMRAWVDPNVVITYQGEAKATTDRFANVTSWANFLLKTDAWGTNVLRPTLRYLWDSIDLVLTEIIARTQRAGTHRHADVDTTIASLLAFVGFGPAPAGNSLSARLLRLESRLGDPGAPPAGSLEDRVAQMEARLAGMPADWEWERGAEEFSAVRRRKLEELADSALAYARIGRWLWYTAITDGSNLTSPDSIAAGQELRSLLSTRHPRLMEIEDSLGQYNKSGIDLVVEAFIKADPDAILRAFRFNLQQFVQQQLEALQPATARAEKSALGRLSNDAMNYLMDIWRTSG